MGWRKEHDADPPNGDSFFSSQKSRSAVAFAAVADTGDLDGIVAFGFEEEAVIATTETEVRARGLEFLHVAGTAGQVAVQASKESALRFRGRWRGDRPGLPGTR